jgi:hypothetical protein
LILSALGLVFSSSKSLRGMGSIVAAIALEEVTSPRTLHALAGAVFEGQGSIRAGLLPQAERFERHEPLVGLLTGSEIRLHSRGTSSSRIGRIDHQPPAIAFINGSIRRPAMITALPMP